MPELVEIEVEDDVSQDTPLPPSNWIRMPVADRNSSMPVQSFQLDRCRQNHAAVKSGSSSTPDIPNR